MSLALITGRTALVPGAGNSLGRAIAPPLAEAERRLYVTAGEVGRGYVDVTPLGRLSRPGDVAKAYLHTLRRRVLHHGESLAVNGGAFLGEHSSSLLPPRNRYKPS